MLDLCSPPSLESPPNTYPHSSSSTAAKKIGKTLCFSPTVSLVHRKSATVGSGDIPVTIIPALPRSSPSPPLAQGFHQNSSPLRYLSLAAIAAAESASTSEAERFNILHGEFLVRGIAVNIRKFKVTSAEGYVVLLSLEEDEPNSREDPKNAKVVLSVLVCTSLCAKYLKVPSREYLSQHEKLSKQASKSFKIEHSLKFKDFKGTFRARSLLPLNSSGGPESDIDPASSTATSSQGVESSSLLLLDFHPVED